ncbi:MAG: sugar phosphate isomerase/epimerase [Ruminococcaceae bacterium]|nr:sugar phosphate isomerase/epimerase [Oscillospiraceae bacterium]
MKMNLALELYSIRDETKKDFFGALEKVAEYGFTGVEFAGYGDIKAEDMKAKLDSLGLVTVSVHHGLKDLEANLDEIIAYNKVLGNKNINCAGAGPFDSWEHVNEYAVKLDKIADILAENGMKIYYHNHAHEFVKFEQDGGRYSYDVMMEKLAGKVGNQFDIYWLYRAGVDAIEYLDKYKDSIELVHIKDGDETTGLPAGTGKVEIKKIAEHAQKLGVEWFILEDETVGDQFGAVKTGIDNIMAL